ncbi:hypothetical protein WJX84_010787 [Apatococcus fuscideae]|uniref:GDP-Man:Man(3)GlcNAc(2)-PP-Dol alpha-1,2-mannosyltransferase n=1 Tax=Apatococcus fuscideae TaxID=2026836 RepID=A0AAW1TPF6_9CHLO
MLFGLAAPLAFLSLTAIAFGWEFTLFFTLGASSIVLTLGLAARVWLKKTLPPKQEGTIAFFHPEACGGGGGERVLWVAVQALQKALPSVKIVVYSASDNTSQQLLEIAADRFNISITSSIQVVQLRRGNLISPKQYPRFTLLRQAIGSVQLAYEGLHQLRPELFIDTSGWAFTYPMCRLSGVRVACYVHYPTVSTDMLQRVRQRKSLYNNSARVADSRPASWVKLLYYYFFAWFYSMAGACANVVMVNSSWTARHIRQLWWKLEEPHRVFPPCLTADLQQLPLDRKLKHLSLVSVAQFRPEKDHPMQLRAYAQARKWAQANSQERSSEAVLASRLKLVGSCRNTGDQLAIDNLKRLAAQLGIADCVDFHVNVPFSELRNLLGNAVAGLHTMVDEHFGISVVEYMAAGVIPIAHDSAGPKEDIVQIEAGKNGYHITGYLCTTLEQYSSAIIEALSLDHPSRLKIAAAARRKALEFSDERFCSEFLESVQPILPSL